MSGSVGCHRPPRETKESHLTDSVAFVTPSYRLDLEHCALLNRSLEACAASYEHWIVVDRGDLPAFRSLQNHRTNVVTKEEILPLWVHRIDTLKVGLRSNLWLQSRGRPIRGWLLQQLVKLAVVESLSADIVVHADSDVVFVHPFSPDAVVDDRGRVRLYERPGVVDHVDLPEHVRWHRSAEKLLGLGPADTPLPDYISSLVPWKRQNAVALLRHVEATTGRHWLRALAEAWHVSEYTLYGRFVRDALGADAGQFVSAAPLCLDYYKRVPLTSPEIASLLDRVGDDAIAVSLTSKAGMKPEDYVELLERSWASPVPAATHDARREPHGQAVSRPGSPDRAATRPTASHRVLRTSYRRLVEKLPRPVIVGATIALLGLTMVFLGFGID